MSARTPSHPPDRPSRGEAELEVRAALCAEEATRALADATLIPIPGGFSHWAWRANPVVGEACFVRLGNVWSERLGADAANEARVLAFAAAAGLAPAVVRCDPASRLLVTRWIDDVGANAATLRRPDAPRPALKAGLRGQDVARLATAVAHLHRLAPPVPALRHVHFDERAAMLERKVSRRDDSLAGISRAVFASLGDGPRVVCHHDLNPENVLLDATRRVWLVDWEYGGLGDPALDLASFASQHGLDARQRARMIPIYLEAGGDATVPHRLDRALWAFDYVQWLWYAAAAEVSTGNDPNSLADRAARLRASLAARARSVLRCNNGVLIG